MAILRGGTLIGGSVAITYKILLNSILTIDGSGSGIDADLLDGHHADYFSPVTHLHDDRYVKKTGDRLTGALNFNIRAGCDDPIVMDLTGVKGGWARGLSSKINNNTVGGVGILGAEESAKYMYMGIGRNPYDLSTCLAVYQNNITYKNNKVWHEGNDGSGSGLDADTVDGIQSSRIIYGDNDRGTATIQTINSITKSGFYYPGGTVTSENPLPEGLHSGIIHYQDPTNVGYFFQIASHFGPDNKLFYRQKSAGNLGEWNRIYHTGNKPTPGEINAINKSGDTGIGKLVFNDTVSIDQQSLVINGPNGSYDVSFRGICVAHESAGKTLIGGIRGGSWENYFVVKTTDDANNMHEILRVGYHDNKFTYKDNIVWHSGNDGSGSGLDADLLDGHHADYFSPSNHLHDNRYLQLSGGTMSGPITTPNNSVGIKFGDDAQISDGNIANHVVLEGQQDHRYGGITFGSGKDTNIYRAESRKLKTDGVFNAVSGYEWNGQSLDDRYSDRALLKNNIVDIIVGGDPNKYYPVVINSGVNSSGNSGIYGSQLFSISRGYAADAPESWYKDTHKGGLTFTFLWAGDCYWGGNDQSVKIIEFYETYSNMVAGLGNSTKGIVVWLRGGNAKYKLSSVYGKASSATVYLETFTDAANNVFEVRDSISPYVEREITPFYPVRRDNSIYDGSRRVYSPNNKPTPADIGAVNKSGDTMDGVLKFRGEITDPNDPMQIGRGKIASWSDLRILANTDNGTDEPLQLASGVGLDPDFSHGLLVYNNRLIYNNQKVWYEGNDGSSSGLDADLLDGLHADSFVKKAGDTMTGDLSIEKPNALIKVQSNSVTFRVISNELDKSVYLQAGKADTDNGVLRITGMNAKEIGTVNIQSINNNGLKVNWNTVWNSGNDGASSGLDADLLDGLHADSFVKKSGDTMTGRLNLPTSMDKGLTIGNVKLEEVTSGSLVMRNLCELRFGDNDAWDWNSWGGIKYSVENNAMFIGGPSDVFNKNGEGKQIIIDMTHSVKEVQIPRTKCINNLYFTNSKTGVRWDMNTDYAEIHFKNDSDGDTDSYLCFETGDNQNEYFKFRMLAPSGFKDLLDIKYDSIQGHVPIFQGAYNDYAEYFEKGRDEVEPGDLIMLDPDSEDEKYIKSNEEYSKFVVGVCSDEFAHCIGGEGVEEDKHNYIPVGLAGRLRVKLVGKAKRGDLITSSNIPGVAMVSEKFIPGTIIGKCLEDKDTEEIERTRILIQIM